MKNIALIVFVISSISSRMYSQHNLTLQIHQPPELIIFAGKDTTLQTGDHLTLGGNPTVTGGLGYYDYYWTPNAFLDNPYGRNPNILNISQPTTYILKVEDANCTRQDTITVLLSNYSSLNEPDGEISFAVYPVPANEKLCIDFGQEDYNIYSIELIDMEGKVLNRYKADKQLMVLNIQAYTKGYYLLKIKNKEIERIVTIVKN